MSEEEKRRYLTTEDVCDIYHVTRRSVYRWRTQGLLGGRKVGRRVLYTPTEVEALADAISARDSADREHRRSEVLSEWEADRG